MGEVTERASIPQFVQCRAMANLKRDRISAVGLGVMQPYTKIFNFGHQKFTFAWIKSKFRQHFEHTNLCQSNLSLERNAFRGQGTPPDPAADTLTCNDFVANLQFWTPKVHFCTDKIKI
jgi:hypothetical protein